MLDVRRLRLLREVKIRGTLSEVAAVLHQSPSSVSQQLSQLEREVGVELLQKAGRRVRLTPQAEILVEKTGRILHLLEEAESDVKASFHEPGGTVRIAVFQSAAIAIIPEALTILTGRYPKMRVVVTQREPETALGETWSSDFDLVVAEQYPNHAAPWFEGLDREHLTSDRIHLGVPHNGTLSAISSVAEAANAPWVMEPRGAASRHFAEQTCRLSGFEPDIRFETADLQAHARLVESGNAISLLPGLLWHGDPPPIQLIGIPGDPDRTIFTATRHATRRSPNIAALREALTQAVTKVGGNW